MKKIILLKTCARIFDHCKSMRNNSDITKLWAFNGIINIKTTEDEYERPKKINTLEDLENYMSLMNIVMMNFSSYVYLYFIYVSLFYP